MAELGTEKSSEARVHDMRFCSNCGTSLTGAERFCSTCGNKIVTATEQNGFGQEQMPGSGINVYQGKKRSNIGLIAVCCTMIAVLMVVCVIIIFSMSKGNEEDVNALQGAVEKQENIKTDDVKNDSNKDFWSQNAATATPTPTLIPTPTTVPFVRKETAASLQSVETGEKMEMYEVSAIYTSADGFGQAFGFSGKLAENVGVIVAVSLDDNECRAGYTFSGSGKEVLKNVEIAVVEDGDVITYTTLQNPNIFYNIDFTLVSFQQGEGATFDIAIDFDFAGDRYLFEAEGTAMYQEAQPVPTQPEPDYNQCVCRGTRICQVCFGWGSLMGETCQGCHGDRTCQYCK